MPALSSCPDRQKLAGVVAYFERTLERCGRSGGFNHDKVIVLPLEAICGKVRGTSAQQSPVNFVALEMHRRGGLVFGAYLDGSRPLDRHPWLRGAVS